MAATEHLSKEQFLSMLEKSMKSSFFLLIISFFMFFDSMMAFFYGIGIEKLKSPGYPVNLELGVSVLIGFIAFSGLVSLFLPFLYSALAQAYKQYVPYHCDSFNEWFLKAVGIEPDTRPRRRSKDEVSEWELRREAHETQSEFLLKLYDEHATQKQRKSREHHTSQFYAFCALFFLSLNYWLPGEHQADTVSAWVERYCSSSLPIWGAMFLLLLLTVIPFHHSRGTRPGIYHPPLYRRLEASDEKMRAQRRDAQAKFARMLQGEDQD